MISPSTTRPWSTASPMLRRGLIILFLGWVFGIIGIFYVVQKPFTQESIEALPRIFSLPFTFSPTALIRTLLDLLTAIWLWLMNLGLGLWLYRQLIKIQQAPNETTEIATLEQIILSLGLGFIGVGLVILGLGLLGFLHPLILTTAVVIATVVTLPQTLRTLKSVQLPAPPRLLKLYLGLTLGLGLTLALLPPSDWDGLFYHLTGPKLYLIAGRIAPGIDIPHLNFPSLFEMHFMLALALRGAVSAKLLHFGFSLALAGLVTLIARRHLGLANGWWAIIFLFSMPMLLTLAGWAYNDLVLAFGQVGGLYALLNYRQTAGSDEGQRWLVITGLLSGLAMSLKYTSFVAPLTLGLLLIWWLWQRRASPGEVLSAILAFSLPALLIAAPWYIKNYLFTANPVYPFALPGHLWDSFRQAAYSSAGTGIGFDLWAWLILPVQLTLGVKDANYIDGRTGPLFLAFLPPVLLYAFSRSQRNRPTALTPLLLFVFAQYLFWMLGVVWSQGLWQSRLLLPAFVTLAPVLAWILHDLRYLNRPTFSLQRFLKLVISLTLILSLADQLLSSQNYAGWLFYRPWAYLVGTQSETDYLKQRVGFHIEAMQAINTQFPADAVVTFLWEPRSFYCQRDCRPDSILDKFGHLQYLHGSDAGAIAQAWRDQGITHLLVHRLGYDHLLADPDTPPELRPNPDLMMALKQEQLELVFDIGGGYQGYRIK